MVPKRLGKRVGCMKKIYPSREIEIEARRLTQLWCDSAKGETVEEIIERYASNEYKEYVKQDKKRRKELEEKGIIE